MTAPSVLRAADANLVAAWAALGRHAGFPVAQLGPITAMASGLPIAFFNSAFSTGVSADPVTAIDETIRFFATYGVPYLLWVRAGADDALLSAGRAAGLQEAGGPPLLALEPPVIARVPPADVQFTVARDDDDLAAHREVLSGGFSMPPETAAALIGASLVDDPDLAVAVGRVSGVPVVTGLLVRTGEIAGLYNIATLPSHQRRGHGEALTWWLVDEAQRRGCTRVVLQASDAGYPLYRRMGFQDLGRYVQLMGPPNA